MNNLSLLDTAMKDPFETVFRGFLAPMRVANGGDELDIRLDVVEKDDAFKVQADLPGVKKEDINVRIDGNRVQIDAEARREKDVKEKGKLVRSERYYGTVSRVFTLSQEVDDAKAVAKYDNGVLSLDLPKKVGTASKKLTIQ
ncbi:Hsp20/alpha crystallin family protein [Rhodoferax sp.]|uniref:Hsp20/alpha crystallin family protein n=1 Tax=Rhodoferax sp. TaxID=50421 RepID=UPI0019FA8156|nr:Hsp20/alpha crystallin family protein [Rhodoferax sp.]MBE0473445.1 Hsp20/alpha crystallin family protein [Rhodoferax sp.]